MNTWDIFMLIQCVLMAAAWTVIVMKAKNLRRAVLVVMKKEFQTYILGVFTQRDKALRAAAEEKKRQGRFNAEFREIELNKPYNRK